jgi:hypothetical protein
MALLRLNLKGFGMNGLIKGKEVHFDEEYLHVKLEDNRIISTPIEWYKPLKKATIEQLKDYKLICLNTGIEWESIDYHLNIENMLEVSLNKVA